MVDAVVRCTVAVVLGLAALNTLHGALVIVRLVRHVAARQPYLGLGLWLPALGSPADVLAWLTTWRAILADPAADAIRAGARTVVARHLYLSVLSQTWAMAATTISPHLA